MISGFTAAAAGIMLAARLSSVPPDMGQGYEMSVIAAVVIGGTSLFGGSGGVGGTVVGSLMVAIIGNGLILLNVNPFYQYVINGVIIILAVALNNARRKR
jgi:ribose transport system permease protein